MAHVTGDRVKDTTTTTGTGDITVSGSAPTGFRTLSAVATSNGDTLFIAIVGGSEWETSLATRVSANVYTRTTILASSNSGSAVNFSAGTKDVFVTLPASKTVSDAAYSSSWDADVSCPPSKNAVHDKFEIVHHPGYVAGNWYFPNVVGDCVNGAALTANRIYYSLMPIPKRVTLSDLGVRISTASAGGNLKLAIYANNASTTRPTGTPLAETASITTASAANVSADITGSNVTLEQGHYWFAVWQDNGTSAVQCLSAGASTVTEAVKKVGSTSQDTISGSTTRTAFYIYSDETYGTWPDAAGETFTVVETGSSFAPLVQIKAA